MHAPMTPHHNTALAERLEGPEHGCILCWEVALIRTINAFNRLGLTKFGYFSARLASACSMASCNQCHALLLF